MPADLHLVVCPFLREEVRACVEELGLVGQVKVLALPERCHPPYLNWQTLRKRMGDWAGDVLILGSACLAALNDPPGWARHWQLVRQDQCLEWQLGATQLRQFQALGAYLISPGWLAGWRGHMRKWGFDQETARSFFRESCRQIVLLDTLVDARAEEHLAEFAGFLDLPATLQTIGREHLCAQLALQLEQWRGARQQKQIEDKLATLQSTLADYAMAVDLVSDLGRAMTEAEATRGIMDLFMILFAPAAEWYMPYMGELVGEPLGCGLPASDDLQRAVREAEGAFQLLPDSDGFVIRIARGGELMGKVGVERVAFPAYLERYVNVALAVAGVCAISIENARIYSRMQAVQAQLRQQALELERSNEEVRQFAHIVSHDFRAPLVNLRGFANELDYLRKALQRELSDAGDALGPERHDLLAPILDQEMPEALAFIGAAITRMDGYITALTHLARLGRHELNLQIVDTRAVAERTLDSLRHELARHAGQAQIGPLPDVFADPIAFEQILGNLLDNAVKYLTWDRPALLEIFAEESPEEIILHVRDNGRGIAPAEMGNVFMPFRRAGKQDRPGEGMGLAYVQTLVRRHGGKLWCLSEPGAGSTFSFSLPKGRPEREGGTRSI